MQSQGKGATQKRPRPSDTPPNTSEAELTVHDVASRPADLPSCSLARQLSEIAEMLLETSKTAAVVVDDAGVPQGLITEDDILQAYFQGVPWDCTAGEWLRGGRTATAPGEASAARAEPVLSQAARPAFSYSSVLPSDSLLRDAIRQLMPSDVRRASHLLVPDTSGGLRGILSNLDVVRAVADRGWGVLGDMGDMSTVAEIMAPLSDLTFCSPKSTMQQLMETMLQSPERVALIADNRGLHGLATASDALWAFSQRIQCVDEAWQRLAAARPAARGSLQGRSIPKDSSLQAAAEAMATSPPIRHLLAVEPGTGKVVGLVSPSHIVHIQAQVETAPLARTPPAPSVPPQPPAPAEAPPAPAEVPVKTEEATEPDVKAISRRQIRRRKAQLKKHHPMTVGEVVAQRETASCSMTETLADACDAMVSSGRTATVVLGSDREVRGLLTENDILQAYCDHVDWDCQVGAWLRGGEARLPGFMLAASMLPKSASLVEAAMCMATKAEDWESGLEFSCHHLIVSPSPESGTQQAAAAAAVPADVPTAPAEGVKVLSSLDIAKGMIEAAQSEKAGFEERGASTAANLTVRQVMKPRKIMPDVDISATLEAAFNQMNASKQNCALVVSHVDWKDTETEEMETGEETAEEQPALVATGAGGGPVHGVVTTSDVLRAFSERQDGARISLAGWLRGLKRWLPALSKRSISPESSVAEAVAVMTKAGVHHLLVVRDVEVLGVVSALDIVCSMGDFFMEQMEAELWEDIEML